MHERPIERALVSVTDKTGIAEFCRALVDEFDVEIISTGGTAELLESEGVEVTGVSEFTDFPEILDGRVKTLHPGVHAGILWRRDDPDHRRQMEDLDLEDIDLVVVNLYDFEDTVAQPDVAVEDAIEKIDIGGPTLLRASAKNHAHVTVVSDPGRYDDVLEEMRDNDGATTGDLRRALALAAFQMTAHYDAAIAAYLDSLYEGAFPGRLAGRYQKKQELRYGENPHQKAAFYVESKRTEPSVAGAEQLGGKDLSFNNLMDADAALGLVKEFDDEAACAVIKHANPCGAARASDPGDAFRKAWAGDPVSAFGSIVAFNCPVDRMLAETIAEVGRFIEVIVAPEITPEGVEVLHEGPKWGANVRLLQTGELDPSKTADTAYDLRRIVGGLLVQTRDLEVYGDAGQRVVSRRKPTEDELADLHFAWITAKHVKSNAITFVRDQALVGVGAGQMSRVDSVRIAAMKAGDRAHEAVMGSDAFFPFRDGVDAAHEAGITAIVQPGGSMRDEEVIEAADEHDMALVFTGMRHFRH